MEETIKTVEKTKQRIKKAADKGTSLEDLYTMLHEVAIEIGELKIPELTNDLHDEKLAHCHNLRFIQRMTEIRIENLTIELDLKLTKTK